MFCHNLEISDDGLYLTSPVNGVDMRLDEYTFSDNFGAPTIGIKSIRSGEGSTIFWLCVVNLMT